MLISREINEYRNSLDMFSPRQFFKYFWINPNLYLNLQKKLILDKIAAAI